MKTLNQGLPNYFAAHTPLSSQNILCTPKKSDRHFQVYIAKLQYFVIGQFNLKTGILIKNVKITKS